MRYPTLHDFKRDRVFTAVLNKNMDNAMIDLKHPSIEGKYRWVAHGFRHRLANTSNYGLHDELLEAFRDGWPGVLHERSFDGRIHEFIDLIGLPNTCTPVLYVEVYDITDGGRNKPMSEEFLNMARTTNRNRHLSPFNTVQTGLMRAAKPLFHGTKTPLDDLFAPISTTFSTWWAPMTPAMARSLARSSPSKEYCLDLDAGQASGAHTYGWLARGGRSIGIQGNNSMNIASSIPIPAPTSTAGTLPPYKPQDVHFRRAGFLLFELQRQTENKTWVHLPQDTDSNVNPLSLPIFLDRSETELVEAIKERSVWVKKLGNKHITSGMYPIRTWSKNHHHLNQRFNNMHTMTKSGHRTLPANAPTLEDDLYKVVMALRTLILSRSHGLFEHMIPEFGESLSGTVW
jgi:hypothetical protein